MKNEERVHGPATDDPLGTEFQHLAAELEQLPAALEPERDLWSGIAGRLEPRAPRSRFRAVASAGAWPLALAAVLGLIAGAAFTWLAMSGDGKGGMGEGAMPGRGEMRSASMAGADLGNVESQFLRAKEELWLVAFSRRGELSPEAWNVVQQNLQILDAAISNLRSALSEDPGNPELEQRLLRNQRLSLDLLQDLTRDGERLKDTV